MEQNSFFMAPNSQNGELSRSPFRENQDPFSSEDVIQFVGTLEENQTFIFNYGALFVCAISISFIYKMMSCMAPGRKKTFGVSNISYRSKLGYHLIRLPRYGFLRYCFSSNFQVYGVVSFIAMTIFIYLYKLTIVNYFLLAYKAGVLSMINISLLYLLPLKHFPLQLLIPNYSYETYLLYHKWLGIITLLILFVHIAAFIRVLNWWYIFSDLVCRMGVVLATLFGLISVTSLSRFRSRFYELFKATHYIVYISSLPFLYLHINNKINKAIVIVLSISVLINKIVSYYQSWFLKAHFQLDEASEFILVTVDRSSLLWRKSFEYELSDHTYITVPRISIFQAHPFTIMSSPFIEKDTIKILIKKQQGFTNKLFMRLLKLKENGVSSSSMFVMLTGPYGNSHSHLPHKLIKSATISDDESSSGENSPLVHSGSHSKLNYTFGVKDYPITSSDEILLIAGGSGIAFALPIYQTYRNFFEFNFSIKVKLVWIVRHESFLNLSVFQELSADPNVTIVITSRAGRPNMRRLVHEELEIGLQSKNAPGRGRIFLLGCGGPSMMNELRATRDDLIDRRYDVRCLIEEFNW